MIGKEIENKDKSSTKASRTGGLAKYITDMEAKITTEKCTYSNEIGFISRTKSAQIKEMIGLSQEAVRSKDTIKHYVFSWKQGENPSNNQMDDSVKILLKETGLEGHQVIYGVHKDTDNIHLHVMVNRVNPRTQKLVEINNGFDIEPIHRAVALIEYKQGWSREKNSRYFVLENGDLCRSSVETKIARQPGQKQRDREYRTGEKSGQRIAIEVAAPIIKNAKSWGLLHSDLAKHGVTYQPAGKGAVVSVAGVNIRASAVSPEASFPKLQQRMGVYQPPMYTHEQSINVLQPLSTDVPGWDAYLIQKNEYEEAKNKQDKMRQRHKDEMQVLKNQQSNERNDLLLIDWVGKRDVLNALRSVMAEDHAVAQKTLRAQQKEELRQLSACFPEWEEWKHSRGKLRSVSRPEPKSKLIVDVGMKEDAVEQNVYSQEASERQNQFKRYSEALCADRYRVTFTRVFKDGSREILVLGGGEEGVRGYDAQELLNKESAIQRLENKGRILQYTPIAEDKHYILIDKIPVEGMARLLTGEYKPSVILSSAPGQFQAIIVIQKSRTPFDDQIFQRLTQSLNNEYGDTERQFVGAIHPNLAPGSVVRLREKSNNVADIHAATLIKAEYCECAKTQSLAAEILQEFQPKSDLKTSERKAENQVIGAGLKEENKAGSIGLVFNPGKLKSMDESIVPTPEKPKNLGPGMS